MTESSTATMIPVSTLAREGLLPVAMGMVLCNDENMAQYVSMVQGLHAEGVVSSQPHPSDAIAANSQGFPPPRLNTTNRFPSLEV
jgi:hypothetical protein